MATILEVKSLYKHFDIGKKQTLTAVNDVSFSILQNETLGLIGESGSGKTTVGRCILRLLEPSSGTIIFKGCNVNQIEDYNFRELRSDIQLVFQEFWSSLNPRWSVERLMHEPLLLHTNMTEWERKLAINQIFERVNLTPKHLQLFPSQLTGGEQQRVGIARAVITKPSFIVLDEPTSSLDPSVRNEILSLLLDLQNEFSISYLFISHDMTAVEKVSHNIAIMYLGKIVEMGNRDELMKKQHHPYSRALLSAVLYPDPKKKLPHYTLSGEIPSPVNLPIGCSLADRCPLVTAECRESSPNLKEITPNHYCACFNYHKISTL